MSSASQPAIPKVCTDFFQSSLVVSDAVLSPPWQSFMSYAAPAVCMCLVLPGIMQAGYMLNERDIQAGDVMNHLDPKDLSRGMADVRVVSPMFTPCGIWCGCGCCYFLTLALLCLRERWRLAADTWLRRFTENHCWCFPGWPTKWEETCCVKCTRQWRRCLFVVVVTLLPGLAWWNPLFWWGMAADQYRLCHRACDAAGPEDAKLCGKLGLPTNVTNATNGANSTNGTGLPHGAADLCFKIIGAGESTKWTEDLLKGEHSFMAFEAFMRQYYVISILDIYGSLFACFTITVVVSAEIALREKMRSLARHRFEYLSNYMVRDADLRLYYIELFEEMCKLQNKLPDSSWTWKMLKEVDRQLGEGDSSARQPPQSDDGMLITPERACALAFKKFADVNLNDTVDDREYFFTHWTHWADIFLTVVFATVDASVPGFRRWVFSRGEQPFFGHEKFQHVVKFTMVLTFASSLSIFTFLLNAYRDHRSQLEKVVSFDCLWRFPQEDPLHTVLRDAAPLMDVETPAHYTGGDFSKGTDLHKLKHWLRIRQYVQIDKIDERVGIEVAVTIALLMLLPRIGALAINLIVMRSNVWSEQALNLQVAWTTICTLGVTIYSLTVTLNLNDLFENHGSRLEKLLDELRTEKADEEHCALAAAERRLAKVRNDTREMRATATPETRQQAVEAAVAAELARNPLPTSTFENHPSIVMVQTLLDGLKKSDEPSTLFGIRVSRKMIAAYVLLSLGSCVPEALVILKDFFKEITRAVQT